MAIHKGLPYAIIIETQIDAENTDKTKHYYFFCFLILEIGVYLRSKKGF